MFLSKTNLPDLFLLCQLAVSTPWEAEYGEKTKAWADVVTALSQNKDDDGKAVFVDGLTAKHVTDCFKALMDYAKQALGNVEKRTGCDDEDPPTEILSLLEEIYEMYNDKAVKDSTAKDEKKNAAKRSRDHAQAICNAALGILEGEVEKVEGYNKKPKADVVTDDLDLAGLVNCAKTMLTSPASDVTEESADRMQLLSRKMDIQERKLHLEEEEMKIRKEDRKQDVEDRKLDREERRQILKNAENIQTALIDIFKKLADN